MNKKQKLGLISGILLLLIVSIGLSFAYFTANLQGSETETTLTVTGGTMRIIFNGGNTINISNIYPKAEAVASKTFTVTGNNTTTLEMPYRVNLVVDSNTFSSNALSYTLTSVNTSNSGTPVASITENASIPTGSGSISLGTGIHTEGTGKVHSYTLNLYFLDTGANQNEDQGKEFKAHVGIEGEDNETICEECLNTKVLAQETGADYINTKTPPVFSVLASELDSGLYASDDEYGISYYYRGERYVINNNLIFAGFQWKIIRINGDGSIRILYNGVCPDNDCAIISSGMMAQITAFDTWNEFDDDNKYVGYMYGGTSDSPSQNREEALENSNDSTAKIHLETWYENNILNQGASITSMISDNLFCNDRQLASEVGGMDLGSGFGDNNTEYASYYRVMLNRNPTLRCAQKNDRFTVSDINIGNGNLKYPIGTITADEILMAGLPNGSYSMTNYLDATDSYWIMSPYTFNNGKASSWYIVSGSVKGYSVSERFGYRPVINLVKEAKVTGSGSLEDPYKVIM